MTLEAPGLPEPVVVMSTPDAVATIDGARERAEQVGRRDEGDPHVAPAPVAVEQPHRALGTAQPGVREWSAAGRGADPLATPASAGSPWPSDALRVGSVERHPGEELRRHAPALAGVVAAAAGARAGGLRAGAARGTARCRRHTAANPPASADRAGTELVVDDERAGVDVADRVDEADDPAGAAHVEPGQRRCRGR